MAPPEPESAAGESSMRKEVRKLAVRSSSAAVAVVDDDADALVDAGDGDDEGPAFELELVWLKSGWEPWSC